MNRYLLKFILSYIFFQFFFLSHLFAVEGLDENQELLPERVVQKIFQRLSGVPILKRDSRYASLVLLAQEGRYREIAEIAVKDNSFASVVSRNWATLLFSQDATSNLILNDFILSAIGSILNNYDARLLLTGDYIFGPSSRTGLGRPRFDSNVQYETLESYTRELMILIQSYTPQWESPNYRAVTSGLITTRSWSEKNYNMGTNRVAVKNILHSFTCQPIESWRDIYLPTFRIRQDIDRAPAGNPQAFQQDCRGCHSPMDALAGAFAIFDFNNGSLKVLSNLAPKYTQNSNVYPDGYVTTDASWLNLLVEKRHQFFGWRGEVKGEGPRSLAKMISDSEAFSRCMVKRTSDLVCGGKKFSMNSDFIMNRAKKFESNGYKLKDLFIDLASDLECLN